MAEGRREAEKKCVEGLSVLQKNARDGYLLQISGASLDISRRRLDDGSREPLEEVEELYTAR